MNTTFMSFVSRLSRWKPLGFEAFPGGETKVGHISFAAPKAYLHTVYRPLSVGEIDFYESLVGRTLTAELRDFYMCCNGFNVFHDQLAMYGLTRLPRGSPITRTRADLLPYDGVLANTRERVIADHDAVVIAVYSEGNRIAYAEKGGKIRVFDPTEGTLLDTEWSTFSVWLLDEVDRYSAIHDDSGKQIAAKRIKLTI